MIPTYTYVLCCAFKVFFCSRDIFLGPIRRYTLACSGTYFRDHIFQIQIRIHYYYYLRCDGHDRTLTRSTDRNLSSILTTHFSTNLSHWQTNMPTTTAISIRKKSPSSHPLFFSASLLYILINSDRLHARRYLLACFFFSFCTLFIYTKDADMW